VRIKSQFAWLVFSFIFVACKEPIKSRRLPQEEVELRLARERVPDELDDLDPIVDELAELANSEVVDPNKLKILVEKLETELDEADDALDLVKQEEIEFQEAGESYATAARERQQEIIKALNNEVYELAKKSYPYLLMADSAYRFRVTEVDGYRRFSKSDYPKKWQEIHVPRIEGKKGAKGDFLEDKKIAFVALAFKKKGRKKEIVVAFKGTELRAFDPKNFSRIDESAKLPITNPSSMMDSLG